MTAAELITELQKLPPYTPIVWMYDDFPHDVTVIDIESGYRPQYGDTREWRVEYYPEVHGMEYGPLVNIAVIR